MRSRRLLHVALALLLLIVVGASLAERERRDQQAQAPPPQAAAAPAAVVRATLPRAGAVRAQAGDTLVLQVRSRTVAEVSIDALGVSAVAGPGAPATLEVQAPAPGRYPVVTELGRRLGVVRVGG